MSALVALENVTVAFGGVKALDDVSLRVEPDSGIVGVIGPNGAGKSTCLAVIAGARRPTSGSVEALGTRLGKRTNPTTMAHAGVARTFQIPRPFAQMTVRENVLVALTAANKARTAELERRADELLVRLGIAEHTNNHAGGLPLAVRKKLEMARGMAIGPKLLLLDEVFEGLSDTEIEDVVEILTGLHRDGIHLILVEHVLRALRRLAQTLVVFEKGKIIAHGEVDQVLESPQVKQAYLGQNGATQAAPVAGPDGKPDQSVEQQSEQGSQRS
ncbi:MAG TPA: ATP-binding cassette domain-containing protein [Jiangellaceae bacterium]